MCLVGLFVKKRGAPARYAPGHPTFKPRLHPTAARRLRLMQPHLAIFTHSDHLLSLAPPRDRRQPAPRPTGSSPSHHVRATRPRHCNHDECAVKAIETENRVAGNRFRLSEPHCRLPVLLAGSRANGQRDLLRQQSSQRSAVKRHHHRVITNPIAGHSDRVCAKRCLKGTRSWPDPRPRRANRADVYRQIVAPAHPVRGRPASRRQHHCQAWDWLKEVLIGV
jgi:hypothetical protein